MNEIIQRYRDWLSRPYVDSGYWRNEEEWKAEVLGKIKELIKINNKDAV